jgi:hypothetical protein
MKTNQRITSGILLVISSLFFQAVPLRQSGDCMEQLRGILEKMNSKDRPGLTSFEYQVRARPRQKDAGESISRVKMRAGKDQTEIISSQMEFYQDRVNAFTVLPSRKLIYWGDSQQGIKKDTAQTNDLHEIQRRVFASSTLKSCTAVENNSQYDKEFVLIPDAELIKRFGFKDITYYVNTRTGSLYRALISYKMGPFEYVEVTYLEISYQADAVWNEPVKSKILNPQGKLLTRYSGYELIDMRAKR